MITLLYNKAKHAALMVDSQYTYINIINTNTW